MNKRKNMGLTLVELLLSGGVDRRAGCAFCYQLHAALIRNAAVNVEQPIFVRSGRRPFRGDQAGDKGCAS